MNGGKDERKGLGIFNKIASAWCSSTTLQAHQTNICCLPLKHVEAKVMI